MCLSSSQYALMCSIFTLKTHKYNKETTKSRLHQESDLYFLTEKKAKKRKGC